MTKAELIEKMEDMPDNTEIVIDTAKIIRCPIETVNTMSNRYGEKIIIITIDDNI